MSTVRTFLVEALQNDWKVRQLDIPTAFLNGELESEVYITIPEGVRINKNNVLKLNRSLYGLKESPKVWNNKFNSVLSDLGFKRSNYDLFV